MPYSNHYSCLIIKHSKGVQNIKLGANYHYDSQKFGNILIELDNYKSYIKSDCVPYVLVYNKLLWYYNIKYSFIFIKVWGNIKYFQDFKNFKNFSRFSLIFQEFKIF